MDGLAEARWALYPEAWGKGIVREAMTAIVDWYAGTQSTRPVTCIVNPDNSSSIRLAEKLGFRLKARTQHKDKPCLMFER